MPVCTATRIRVEKSGQRLVPGRNELSKRQVSDIKKSTENAVGVEISAVKNGSTEFIQIYQANLRIQINKS